MPKRKAPLRRVRYQVLWDNRDRQHPDAPYGHVDFGPGEQKLAEATAEQFRTEGRKNVSVWDTLDNPLSNMFRL